ncbi:MAG: CoA transferase [Dehalococcoidia bacterium]|nr:CoA transferase [Dehalococcoidia bacterium]
MPTPLDGITILDFTRYQQGPYATALLADFGARVIKIEDPNGGDFGRRMWREPDGYSAFWESLNRGKASVTMDLRDPAQRATVLQLGAKVDVVVENFRPGTMEAWGLDYEAFKAVNSTVIYARATGWGTKGPMASLPSFDQISQAFSGFAQHSGGGAGSRPEIPYPGIADQSGAMNLALGIMTALFVRERTGTGQRVEVSLLGTQLALQAPDVLHTLHFGKEREREFRASPTVGHYQCQDGRWIMIVGIDQKFWPRIATALEVPYLIDDPKFARGYPRYVNREELQGLLETAFASKPSGYWLERLREADVPASPVLDYPAMIEQEQPWANDYLATQEHPRFGTERVVGLHIQLSETPGRVGAAAPELGADTEAVLRWAGLAEGAFRE